jgi:general secretion pathway protein A
MDREWVVNADLEVRDEATAPILPSRVEALGLLRASLGIGYGPVLLTGEAGAGKSWLWQRLMGESETRVLAIDLAPATEPEALYRTIGHRLGLSERRSLTAERLALGEHLRERAEDGRSWTLVLDEAHTGSDAVLEEVRILSNRLGRPDGFAGLILVGQTGLARRLTSQPLEGLGTRLAARIHLRPIDADEARELLTRQWRERAWSTMEIETLHRDAAGNPRRLLRLAQARLGRGALAIMPSPAPLAVRETNGNGRNGKGQVKEEPEAVSRPVAAAVVPTEPPRQTGSQRPMPLLGSSKPPIHVEDGLIEVGWDPTRVDDEAELAPARKEPMGASVDVAHRSGPGLMSAGASLEGSEETIDDHYAALQAWNEWAQNQGRAPVPPTVPPADSLPSDLHDAAEEELKADGATPQASGSNVWVEGPDSFAPYSQLFSRLRPSKDPG